MGNCLRSQPADRNPSSKTNPSSTTPVPATPGTQNGVGLSDGSSSAGQSRFPLAASDDGEILATPNLRVYSFSDLKSATKGFKPDMILGGGGFGTVYKGWLDERTLSPSQSRSGMIVAIKKLNPENVSTGIMGALCLVGAGYIATGHLYGKSDVYGFGVVLLEMMPGLRALDNNRPWEQINLIYWAKPLLRKRKGLKLVMDARIEGQYSSKAATLAAKLTLHCLEPDPKKRPSMKEVVVDLEKIKAMK